MLGDLPPKFAISLNTLHGAKWGCIRIRIAKYAKPVLNNGEARNALARALLFNRLRGIRTVISSSSDTEPAQLDDGGCCALECGLSGANHECTAGAWPGCQ